MTSITAHAPRLETAKSFLPRNLLFTIAKTMTRALYFGAQNGGLMWKGRTLLSASSGKVMKKRYFCYLTLV
uniref:Uncharacterized protein n=1 Tax=Populus trichocarpa TaxID=3694 RepID=A0A2K1YIZ6_POPTR